MYKNKYISFFFFFKFFKTGHHNYESGLGSQKEPNARLEKSQVARISSFFHQIFLTELNLKIREGIIFKFFTE